MDKQDINRINHISSVMVIKLAVQCYKLVYSPFSPSHIGKEKKGCKPVYNISTFVSYVKFFFVLIVLC